MNDNIHYVESVQVRSYFWSVFSCMRTEYGPEITPYLDTFYAVIGWVLLTEIKGELYSLYFSSFCVNWPWVGFYNPTYKNEFFFFQNSHLTSFARDIYMAFYLLTWTCFNDVIGFRNILINSQLKRILFISSDKKMKQNWERQKKHGKRK